MKRLFNRVLGMPMIVLLSPVLLYYRLFPTLDQRAWRALRHGDLEKAESLAKQALHEAQHKARDWNYGNAIHDANQMLGLVQMRRGNVKKAKRHLVLAGKTPGSPQLDSFGPRLVLARELAEQGESEAVLQYLQAISRLYANRRPVELARKDSPLWKRFVAVRFRHLEEKNNEDTRQLYQSWREEIEGGKVPQHPRWR